MCMNLYTIPFYARCNPSNDDGYKMWMKILPNTKAITVQQCLLSLSHDKFICAMNDGYFGTNNYYFTFIVGLGIYQYYFCFKPM